MPEKLTLFGMVLILGVIGIVGYLIINFLEKLGKKKRAGNQNDLSVYFSSNAVAIENEYHFSRLISEIACYRAAVAGKFLTPHEHHSREKVISVKDMEDAFLLAIRELNGEISKCVSCDKSATLLDKICLLRKEYKKKYEEEKEKEYQKRKQVQTP